MTSFDDSNPALRPNPYVQSIGKTADHRRFEQSALLRIEHEDPSLHYIGEGLPVPGETEPTYAGRDTATGTSPIPARADHSHDTYLRYCGTSNATGVTCAPGQTLLTHTFGDGENFLVSGSLFLLPQAGIWLVSYNLFVARSGGGNFANQVNTVNYYVNGTAARGVYRNEVTGLPVNNYITVADTVFYDDFFVDANTSTVEIAYQHNDTVNHQVSIYNCVIMRLANAVVN